MATARRKANCLECMGKDMVKRQRRRWASMPQTERQRISNIGKSRWNALSPEEQEKIKQAGIQHCRVKH